MLRVMMLRRMIYPHQSFSAVLVQKKHSESLYYCNQSVHRWNLGLPEAPCSLFSSATPTTSDDAPEDRRTYKEESWQSMMKELHKFVKYHNHARVPEKWSKNPTLARWIAYNRGKYRAGVLEQERVEQLEALGMVWNPYESDWEERYAELKLFQKKNGHCRVSQTQSDLGRWVVAQRYQYRLYLQGKASHMAQERIDQLNSIDFEWEPQETVWMNHYQNLQAFRREHGHWCV